MKQGKSYFTVILWILLAAIAAYFGYNVVSSLYAPLMTATVTPYEAGAGYYASGFVVREEELLYSQYGTTVLNCAEGRPCGRERHRRHRLPLRGCKDPPDAHR